MLSRGGLSEAGRTPVSEEEFDKLEKEFGTTRYMVVIRPVLWPFCSNGHYAVVGVEIKSPGKDMTVNAVKTVFGDERIDINKDDVVYSRKNGEGLRTLLGEPNSPEYSETPRVGNSIAQNGDVVNGGAKPVDHSGDWAPVSGKTGVFHTAEFPEVEIALQDAQPGEGTKPVVIRPVLWPFCSPRCLSISSDATLRWSETHPRPPKGQSRT